MRGKEDNRRRQGVPWRRFVVSMGASISEAVCRIQGEAKAEGEAGQNTHCIPTKKLGIELERPAEAKQRLSLSAGRSQSRGRRTRPENPPRRNQSLRMNPLFAMLLTAPVLFACLLPRPADDVPPLRGLRGCWWPGLPRCACDHGQGGGVAEKVAAALWARYR